ncbi:MAG: NADP-dependent phosphogluconate dehydrogenase, partial [Saprospiraceae bacterium]|nr:NADP-dependent phosphogluconate dehydrogenase [Saprospiraceae bacterium]
NNDDLHETFAGWNQGRLRSFLIGITADVFLQPDELSDNRLIDMIRGSARQKGTGMWTSQNAFDMHVPIPVIDMAVTQRDMSAREKERSEANSLYRASANEPGDRKSLTLIAEEALYFATIIAYAQGMSLLHSASESYGYELNFSEVAGLWRGGCIIRAALLEDIRTAYAQNPSLPNLLLDSAFAEKLEAAQESTRHIVKLAVDNGIPMPALMACLSYFDSYKRGWLPANLIQAQRDYFGAHTYERIDREGTFHTKWSDEPKAG